MSYSGTAEVVGPAGPADCEGESMGTLGLTGGIVSLFIKTRAQEGGGNLEGTKTTSCFT